MLTEDWEGSAFWERGVMLTVIWVWLMFLSSIVLVKVVVVWFLKVIIRACKPQLNLNLYL